MKRTTALPQTKADVPWTNISAAVQQGEPCTTVVYDKQLDSFRCYADSDDTTQPARATHPSTWPTPYTGLVCAQWYGRAHLVNGSWEPVS